MANAITKNQNILKFGYSFRQAAPRNKADRAIIKNNEISKSKHLLIVNFGKQLSTPMLK